jgi:hypothetical protein
MVISFKANNREAILKEVIEQIREVYPDYEVTIAADADFSD